MAWGVFKKIGEGIKSGVKFMKEKLLPGAKKIVDVVAPYVPFGQQAQNILGTVSNITDKVSEFTKSSGPPQGYVKGERIKTGGELPSDVRQWLNTQIRA